MLSMDLIGRDGKNINFLQRIAIAAIRHAHALAGVAADKKLLIIYGKVEVLIKIFRFISFFS